MAGPRCAQSVEDEARARLLWSGSSTIPEAHVGPHCVVNRLGCGTRLTHKDRLVSSLRRGSAVQLAPLTFKLPRERAALLRHSMQQSAVEHGRADAFWIVKPCRSGRGRGIYITRNINDISPEEECVACEYLRAPLLVQGHKLDLRLFVLVTRAHAEAGVHAYVHRAGYVRFANKPYSLDDLLLPHGSPSSFDPLVHLTYLNSFDREKHRQQRAKEWTVEALLGWLAQQQEYGPQRSEALWRDIRQLIWRTVRCLPRLPPPCCADGERAGAFGGTTECATRAPAFELFGFDVLLDCSLRPWLLEVRHE